MPHLAPDWADSRPSPLSVRAISEREFLALRDLIYREAGIKLTKAKRSLLTGRLNRRLRALGLDSFGDYYRYVTETDGGELQRMLDCICTNETQFFREPQHFELLREKIFPKWEALASHGQGEKLIRAWSAGCSTGEEPYSLAMELGYRFGAASGWRTEILASDLSTRALAQARRGVWPIANACQIPEHLLKRFMLRGTGSQRGSMAAGPELRLLLTFQHLNLFDTSYPVAGFFDLIFCRNVLIYFDDKTRLRVVRQLLRHLQPEGYLFLGHAEGLHGADLELRRVIPAVYVCAPGNRTKRAGGAPLHDEAVRAAAG